MATEFETARSENVAGSDAERLGEGDANAGDDGLGWVTENDLAFTPLELARFKHAMLRLAYQGNLRAASILIQLMKTRPFIRACDVDAYRKLLEKFARNAPESAAPESEPESFEETGGDDLHGVYPITDATAGEQDTADECWADGGAIVGVAAGSYTGPIESRSDPQHTHPMMLPRHTFRRARLRGATVRAGRWLVAAAAVVVVALCGPMPGDWRAAMAQDSREPVEADETPNRIKNDNGTETWFYRCQHRLPGDMFAILDRYKSGAGKINRYDENNTLIIIDTPERLRLLERLLKKIDVPRPQVLVEVKVISLTYETDFQLGFETQWDLADKDNHNKTFFRGWELTFHPEDFLRSLNANPPPSNANANQIKAARDAAQNDFQGSTMFFRAVGPTEARIGSLDATVRMLQGTGRASVVARPAVLVESGFTATIEAGQEVPIQNRNVINNNTVVGIEYKTVGVKLKLTPHLVGPDHVRLTVEPEVSTVSRFFDPGGTGLLNPIIRSAGATTTASLHSGETLEIGGLRSTRSLIQQTGIPLLMDIPIVGYLFRASRKELRRQDVVFFITPRIFHGVSDAPDYAAQVTSDYEYFGSGRTPLTDER